MHAAADTDAPQPVSLPPVQAYHPTTFLERGVVLPFTTPALLGARARPGMRGGTEILVRNPAGGRGVYILPWDGVCGLCHPTVHDTILNQRLSALRSITPGSIRRVAREIAAEGLAGREASSAALARSDGERQDRLRANFLLLMRLLEQRAPAEMRAMSERPGNGTDLDLRARRALARIAPDLGGTPESIASAVEELGVVFGDVGIAGQSTPARVQRLLDATCELRDDMRAFSRQSADDNAPIAEMIAAVAALTVACANQTLNDAHALTGDVPALLRQWVDSPNTVTTLAGRPEWLVDGWEEICLLWRLAKGSAAQRSALAEMAMLVPVLPREVSNWVGVQIDTELVSRFRRTVRLNQDWRTGTTVEQIAFNEHLRAMAL